MSLINEINSRFEKMLFCDLPKTDKQALLEAKKRLHGFAAALSICRPIVTDETVKNICLAFEKANFTIADFESLESRSTPDMQGPGSITIIKGRSVGPTCFMLKANVYDSIRRNIKLKPIAKEPYYKRFDKNRSKFKNFKKL